MIRKLGPTNPYASIEPLQANHQNHVLPTFIRPLSVALLPLQLREGRSSSSRSETRLHSDLRAGIEPHHADGQHSGLGFGGGRDLVMGAKG